MTGLNTSTWAGAVMSIQILMSATPRPARGGGHYKDANGVPTAASVLPAMGTLDPMASSERKTRTAGLDGLRAIAALSVLCLHVWLYGQPDPDSPTRSGLLDRTVFEFRLGLVFFFVLSGYLLYRAFAGAALRRSADDVGRYARRRVARIVPAYYLALAGTVALLWGLRGSPGVRLPDAAQLPLFLVFGQNYSSETFFTLNPVTWTLCLEAAFYVSLPLIGLAAYRLARGRVRAQAGLLAAIALAGLAYSAVDYELGWGAMAGKALPAYLPVFAAGVFVALLAEARPRREAPPLSAPASFALVTGGFGPAIGDGLWDAAARTPARHPPLSHLADGPAPGRHPAHLVPRRRAGRGRLRRRGGRRRGRPRAIGRLDARASARLGRARVLRRVSLARPAAAVRART